MGVDHQPDGVITPLTGVIVITITDQFIFGHLYGPKKNSIYNDRLRGPPCCGKKLTYHRYKWPNKNHEFAWGEIFTPQKSVEKMGPLIHKW